MSAISELLDFHSSAGNTIGIEVEMQILDRVTLDLAPGAIPILTACKAKGILGVSAEFKQSIIEIKTGICRDVLEAQTQLYRVARDVRNIATSLGYEIALSGTHPFTQAASNIVYPSKRYHQIMERMGWIGGVDLIFGVHIHIGMESGDTAVGVMNNLSSYVPHLLAVSANSPFWEGVDTELASTRAAIYRLLPRSGIAPPFGKWKDLRNCLRMMLESGAIHSLKDIYWDIRPRPDYGTLEFRIFDTPPTLSQVGALAVLTRSLVRRTQRQLLEKPALGRGSRMKQWIATENKWSAMRYGLKGAYIRTPSGRKGSIGKDLERLLGQLLPIAEESGESELFKMFFPFKEFEMGSDRQRRVYRTQGNFKGVMEDLVGQFVEDLDLRIDRWNPLSHIVGEASGVWRVPNTTSF